MDNKPTAVVTGLLWVSLKDLSRQTLDLIKHQYSYVHPMDPTQVFETFIILKDKVGVPFGDQEKAFNVLKGFKIEDKRVAPTFEHPAELTDLQLRPYQQEVLEDIIRYLECGGTSLNLAGLPSAGKSVSLAALLVQMKIKVLIIAHMSMLTTQLFKEFQQNTTANIKVLDKDNLELGDINIATSQFISKRPELWQKIKYGIGAIVVDEAESLASLTTLRIFQRAHAKYKIAVTATFTRSVDARTEALTDIIGHKKFVLENKNILVPQITMVKCPEVYPQFISTFMSARQKSRFFKQPSVFEKVCELIELSLSLDRQVLVAIDIQEFQERLRLRYGTVGVLNGSTKKSERARILEEYDKGNLKVLVAGMVVNAGLSIPKITTIIRVSFPASAEKNVQLVGRALRDFEGKQGAFIWDLVFANKPPTARVAAYRAQGYSVTIKTYKELINYETNSRGR